MRWFASLARLTARPSVAEQSRQIALRTYALVCAEIDQGNLPIRRSELRGYIRAKAAPFVRAEVRALNGRDKLWSDSAQLAIVSRALDRVVQSVLFDVGRARDRQAPRQAA